jgi:hypothetical protein
VKKPNLLLIGGIVTGLLACCLGIAFIFFVPTTSVQATVSDVYWQTSVPVEEVRAVSYNNERGSPPSGAYNVSCDTQSEEVCEQKTIDQGNGYAEVVEDCHTETEQYAITPGMSGRPSRRTHRRDDLPITSSRPVHRSAPAINGYIQLQQVDNGIKNYNPVI